MQRVRRTWLLDAERSTTNPTNLESWWRRSNQHVLPPRHQLLRRPCHLSSGCVLTSLLRLYNHRLYLHRAVSLCHRHRLVILWFVCERCCCRHLPRPKQHEDRSLVDQHLRRPNKAKRDIMTSYQAKDGVCGLFRLYGARVENNGDGQKGPVFTKACSPLSRL
ncbi:hypothetical protein F5887DRAFT_978145 [Amanita rubescens]|nr:hypothetical protein F5887DRAFT_978145 [Amanita rubescens]